MFTRNIIALLIILATAANANAEQPISDKTENTSEVNVNLADFNRIDCDGTSKVVFTQAKKCSIKVVRNGDSNRFPSLSVENGILTINNHLSNCIIYVEAPDLKSVHTSGFSSIEINDLKVNGLTINSSSGSSSISIGNIKCKYFAINTDGFSKYRMNGLIDAKKVEFDCHGNSTADSIRIKADSIKANYSGFCKQKVNLDCKFLTIKSNGNISLSGTVTADKININSQGFSNITLNQQGDEVVLSNQGSGNFNINLNCKLISANNSGFGKIKLSGYADSTKIDNSGNSLIDIRNLNNY